jgi:hypothetical membrane protein
MSNFNTPSVAPSGTRSPALRLCLWAGIVGPVLFVLVFTVDGALTPGYSAMRDVISFLELGPAGWIQRLNFILTGLLIILFALGFFQWMRPRSVPGWLSVTTILIALSGVGLIMAGPFLPDAPGTAQTSVHGVLHTLAFTVVFLPLGLACLSVGGKFIHGWYSLLAGLFPIIAALGNLYSSFVVSNASNTPFYRHVVATRGWWIDQSCSHSRCLCLVCDPSKPHAHARKRMGKSFRAMKTQRLLSSRFP